MIIERRQEYPAILEKLENIHVKVTKIDTDLNGNGKEGMKQRLVRVETIIKLAGSLLSLVAIVSGGLILARILG